MEAFVLHLYAFVFTFMIRIDVCSFVEIDVGTSKLTLFGHKRGRKGVKLATTTKGHPDIFFNMCRLIQLW
jgi:hypothetical protein